MNFERMSFLELLHELEIANYKLGLNAADRFIDEEADETENKLIDECHKLKEEIQKRYREERNKNHAIK